MRGKLALVTGATSGIGEATARQLAQRGCRLIITGRRSDRLKKLKSELAASVEVQDLCFDIRDRSECEATYKAHRELFSKVDFLINNAGLAKGVEPIPKANIDDWETMIDTNIKGLLFVTRLVLPHMIDRKMGHIVNLGSVAGRWVYPGGGVYCATKHAVLALSEGMRMDLVGTPIRVTNIEPGRVETEFSIVRLEDEGAAKRVYQGMTPLTANDIAECIVWCLDRPAHVNVQEMVIYPTDQAAITLFNKK